MQVGDLVVYNPIAVGGMTGDIAAVGRSEDYGLGIVLDENPYYYFINWSNVVGPMLAHLKGHVLPATIENIQQIREHIEREKKLDKWATI